MLNLNAPIASETLCRYADLLADVLKNRLTLADAEKLAANRFKMECGMDEEEHHISSYERTTMKEVGGRLQPTKGWGHRSLGAKAHGKSTVCVSGSGYGRYDAERLHTSYAA